LSKKSPVEAICEKINEFSAYQLNEAMHGMFGIKSSSVDCDFCRGTNLAPSLIDVRALGNLYKTHMDDPEKQFIVQKWMENLAEFLNYDLAKLGIAKTSSYSSSPVAVSTCNTEANADSRLVFTSKVDDHSIEMSTNELVSSSCTSEIVADSHSYSTAEALMIDHSVESGAVVCRSTEEIAPPNSTSLSSMGESSIVLTKEASKLRDKLEKILTTILRQPKTGRPTINDVALRFKTDLDFGEYHQPLLLLNERLYKLDVLLPEKKLKRNRADEKSFLDRFIAAFIEKYINNT